MIKIWFALILATCFLAFVPQPAQAVNTSQDCWHDNEAQVCIRVHWTASSDGHGINTSDVHLSCDPLNSFELPMQVNGKSLRLTNSNGVLKWSKSDGESNIVNSCGRTYVNVTDMPNESGCVTMGYVFVPKWNNIGRDENQHSVAVTYCNPF